MTSAKARELLGSALPALRALGVRELRLFGSVSRDEARDVSDVDVLVEFDGRATFDGYMETRELLERVLGRRVDLVTSRAVPPALRASIEKDSIRVA